MDLFHSDWPGVVRSKGFFWLATRMEWVGEMSQAGGMLQHKAMTCILAGKGPRA